MAALKGPRIVADAARCTGCLVCQLRCSLRFEKAFVPAKARLAVEPSPEPGCRYRIHFLEGCDGCGACASYCPYGALTQPEGRS